MNLLITGAWNDGKKYIPELEAMGHKVCFMQYEKDALPCAYEWVEGVICNGLFLSHDIKKFTALRYIQLTSAGTDRVDVDYINEKGIRLYNARGVYSIPMAEFALCGVLQIYKQAEFFRENQKAHRWEKHRGILELYKKHVCIVGCGSVGTECAKRFKAFGCKVTGVDMLVRQDSSYDEMLPLDKLDEVLTEADIIVLCVPLTDETYHLINNDRLNHVKDGAVLVNISRGPVTDTPALQAHSKRLGGLVLDVFEEEPLNNISPLWDLKQTLITPHNSFVGDGNGERVRSVIFESLKDC